MPEQQALGTPLPRLRTAPAGDMGRQRSCSAPVTPWSHSTQMQALRGPPEAAAAVLARLEDGEAEDKELLEPLEPLGAADSQHVEGQAAPSHADGQSTAAAAESRQLHRLASSSSAGLNEPGRQDQPGPLVGQT